MATAKRDITITYASGVSGQEELNAALNTDSPAVIELKYLQVGINYIQAPTSPSGGRPTGVTIVPPADNEAALTLLGYNYAGATPMTDGVPIHPTDPTSIALSEDTGGLILASADVGNGGGVQGVRLFWT